MKFLALSLFLLFSMSFFSQTKMKEGSIGVRFNRNDFYEENSVLFPKTKLIHELGLGFGINKTFFQQRVNPELFYSLNTNLSPLNKFHIQGMASYCMNFYNVNRNQREIHFFNEVLVGVYVAYGSKWKVFLQPQFGLISESFHSDFYHKTENNLNFSYSAKIGISHAF